MMFAHCAFLCVVLAFLTPEAHAQVTCLSCKNGGSLKGTPDCACRCPSKFYGLRCEKVDCSNKDPSNCGIAYPKKYCSYNTVRGLCVHMCDLCPKPDGSNPDYVAEVYVVVEPQVIKNYHKLGWYKKDYVSAVKADIEKDLEFLMNEVNKYFRTMLKGSAEVDIRIKKMDIQTDSDPSILQATTVTSKGADQFVKDFGTWLTNQKSYDNVGYDTAILLTGHDLSKTNGVVPGGYSAIGDVCTGASASVAQYYGTQESAVNIARQIAHSLGAKDDPEDGCKNSEPAKGYLMSPYSIMNYTEQRWEFSACSIADVKRNGWALKKAENLCLTTTTTQKPTFNISEHYERNIMNDYQQCARNLNDERIYFCTPENFAEPDPDMDCEKHWCGRQKDDFCSYTQPTDEMVCNWSTEKRCRKGKCVAAPGTFPKAPMVPAPKGP